MSSILYYSNYCEHSKKLLTYLTKNNLTQNVHFIPIDNRVRDPNTNQLYIVLQNGQRIVMPPTVTKVPALLLLNEGYKVLLGDDIYRKFQPTQMAQVRQATQNNLEPMAFSLGGGGAVASDTYSFCHADPRDLAADGNGGLMQMHNYVGYNDNYLINPPDDKTGHQQFAVGSNTNNSDVKGSGQKMSDDQFKSATQRMQEEREADMKRFMPNRPNY